MAYSDFSIERITKIFGINIEERTNVFTAFDQLTVDAFLSNTYKIIFPYLKQLVQRKPNQK